MHKKTGKSLDNPVYIQVLAVLIFKHYRKGDNSGSRINPQDR